MRIEGTFLRSRVGRRIFLSFFAVALVPTVLLSALVYQSVSDSAKLAAQREGVARSKNFGLTLFERLIVASKAMDSTLDTVNADITPRQRKTLAPFFTDILRVRITSPDSPLSHDDIARASLSAKVREQIQRNGTGSRLVLLPPSKVDGSTMVLLLAATHADASAGTPRVVGVINPRFLWGARDEFDQRTPTCVLDSNGRSLFCSDGVSPADRTAAHLQPSSWTIFLRGRFGAPSWTVVTYASRRSILKELPGLSRLVMSVWTGTLLLVALLSLIQIRRTMMPLEDLIKQTRQLASGGYAPGTVHGRDEFGQLTGAFDEMVALVTRQLGTLQALSEVDRKILARRDLDEIVDLVIGRVQQILPDAAICILDASDDGGALCHARAVAAEVTVSARVQARDVEDPGKAVPGVPHWHEGSSSQCAQPQMSLRSLGAQRVITCMLGRDAADRVVLGLGLATDRLPANDRLQEVYELGGRIAVAIAAKQREDLLLFQARHDVLTGLPNRFAAYETLAAAIAESAASDAPFAVMFFDLDRFKAINDGLGHQLGDQVLVRVAATLRRHFSDHGFVARFGGDEFFLILPNTHQPADVASAALGIVEAFAAPIWVDGVEFVIGSSIGIAVCPHDGDSVEALVRNADIAMYEAKGRGGGCYAFFEKYMTKDANDRMQLENDLRLGMKSGQIEAYFQPRVDCRTGRITGAEALVRWQHPTRGMIQPLVFVTIAEKCGMIEELGALVLDDACRQFMRWKQDGYALESVAVNVSTQQLQSDRFVDTVRQVMEVNGMQSGDLEIEITESVLLDNMALATERLEAVRELGVSVAIDDFGTGYSSLLYLKSLPIDILKIDRAFIIDMVESEAARSLTQAIIAMARATGKRIVAEGVETTAQARLLESWGSYIIQGFLYHRPMTADAMIQALALQVRLPE